MGFPSPANDYVESCLTVDRLCHMDANCIVIDTSSGYAVINRALRVKQGSPILINHCGRIQFAKLMGEALITSEGEALEGESLDDVDVIGVVTFFINSALQEAADSSPI
ncbi:hypothetical protein OGV71_12070 [Citrobacter sp. Cf088]|uniref:hypothetical protein n=1 Tax=Citrobacter sp. Cf088 TaxID=2985055 RepID=UPI002576F085|nr:hypothetical protein [Citrobacter sp. Cf088]MDM3222460.1 hypothetical protein [Citrobacter sp. Cf088]